MITTSWIVGIGGQPQENCEEFETLEEAEERALEMAKEIAVSEGIDPDSVDNYDNSWLGGGRGACPEGDDGAYWPYIEEGEEQ